MDTALLSLSREALLLALIISAPPLLAALATGLITGILQAATQVQDPSLAVAPRLGAVLITVGLTAPWVSARVVRFAAACLELIPRVSP